MLGKLKFWGDDPGKALCESSLPGATNGHINWNTAVTYEGKISWDSYDTGWGGLGLATDGDINLKLVTPNHAGLTIDEKEFIKVEFNDSETIDGFVTDFWTSGGLGRLNGNYGIVTGLFGLDLVHDVHSELHPAYLVAVRVSEPRTIPSSEPEHWAFFVRNWGNEGMCGHKNWPATPKIWVFKLPWRAGAKTVLVDQKIMGPSGTAYDIRPLEIEKEIVVAVFLGDYSARNIVHGEIFLYWDPITSVLVKPTPVTSVLVTPTPAGGPMKRGEREQVLSKAPGSLERAIESAEPSDNSPEARLKRAVARLPAEERTRFAAAVGSRERGVVAHVKEVTRQKIDIPIQTTSIWTASRRRALLHPIQPIEDKSAAERSLRIAKALCEAYKNNVPEFPGLCKKP